MLGDQLDPIKWEKAKTILLGDDPERCSVKAAANAAGVRVAELQQWSMRSRERRPEDEPWVWEIADICDESKVNQAGTCEDEMWKRAFVGREEEVWANGEKVGTKRVKSDRLLEKLLSVRDERYIERKHQVNENINHDVDLDRLGKQLKAHFEMRRVNGELDKKEAEDATLLGILD